MNDFKCPLCASPIADRPEVDVGVGVIHGPWHCFDCGWSEPWLYPNDDDADPDEQQGGEG